MPRNGVPTLGSYLKQVTSTEDLNGFGMIVNSADQMNKNLKPQTAPTSDLSVRDSRRVYD